MAFKLVAFAALIAVVRASHIGYASAPVITYGSHDAISTYSTHQHHAPAVHSYAAPLAYAAPAGPLVLPAPAPVAYAAPIAKAIIPEPSAPAHYDYGYAVSDPLTGDHKTQQESRRGDVVQGSYSLLESDGTKRIVEYSADDHNGFNAIVHKEPVAVHPAPIVAKVAAPLPYAAAALAAPLLTKVATPLSYAGPALAGSVVAHGYAAPSLAHGYAAHAPALSYAAHAPALSYAASTW